jgi:hypothetical protein
MALLVRTYSQVGYVLDAGVPERTEREKRDINACR